MSEYSSVPCCANPSFNKTVSFQVKTVGILTYSKSRILGIQLALCGVMLWLGIGRFSHVLSCIMLVLGQYYYDASEGYDPDDEYGQVNHANNWGSLYNQNTTKHNINACFTRNTANATIISVLVKSDGTSRRQTFNSLYRPKLQVRCKDVSMWSLINGVMYWPSKYGLWCFEFL